VLTSVNITQIFDEHQVFALDEDAEQQRLWEVILTMGEARASYLGRASRLEDGLFAAWAICLPMFRQPRSYTELMHDRRRSWFPPGLSSGERRERARRFFTESLYRLELHELGNVINSDMAEKTISDHLGSLDGPEIEGDIPLYRAVGDPDTPVGIAVEISGYEVEAIDGSIGKVDAATNDVAPQYIVVDTGPWIFGKKVVLPVELVGRIDTNEQKVGVNRTKDEIKNAPEFDEAQMPAPDYRAEIESYYGTRRAEYRD
jgi:hypothetical protein